MLAAALLAMRLFYTLTEMLLLLASDRSDFSYGVSMQMRTGL